ATGTRTAQAAPRGRRGASRTYAPLSCGRNCTVATGRPSHGSYRTPAPSPDARPNSDHTGRCHRAESLPRLAAHGKPRLSCLFSVSRGIVTVCPIVVGTAFGDFDLGDTLSPVAVASMVMRYALSGPS